MIQLPEHVTKALMLLEDTGYEGYVVGGGIRDLIMGKTPTDYDITTNAKPEEILLTFSGYKTIPTGIKHGTITVLLDKIPLEITTYRIDGDYTDHRRPDTVTFTTKLQHDLARRDFTVNAIAYNPKVGLVDPFCGIDHINSKLIKAVGNPDIRFEEDALRILRCLRFAATLDFTIHPQTHLAVHDKKHLLKSISIERITTELTKTILAKDPSTILQSYTDVYEQILPELRQNHNNYAALQHLPPIFQLRLAAMLCNMIPSIAIEYVKSILKKLKLDNLTIQKVLTLIHHHKVTILPTKPCIKHWLNKLTPPLFDDLLTLKSALSYVGYYELQPVEELSVIKHITEKILKSKECYRLSELSVDGNDLIAIGIKQGIQIKEILQTLLSLVIEGRLKNDKESLINYVKSNHALSTT